jgi:hypothetical protein
MHAVNFLSLDPTPFPAVVQVGQTLLLNVDIFSQDPVFGFQFDLLFPTFLHIDPSGITEQSFFAATGCCFSVDPSQIDNVNGKVTNLFDAVSGPSGLTTTGLVTLLQFQFQVINAPGTGQITLDNILLTDDNFDSLTVDPVIPLDVTAEVGSPIQPPDNPPDIGSSTPEPAPTILMAGGLLSLIAVRRWAGARHGQTCD